MTAGSAQDIEGVAASWLARMESGSPSEVERGELDAWLADDVRHRGAYVRAQALWSLLDQAAHQTPSASTSQGEAPVEIVDELALFRARKANRPGRAIIAGLMAVAASAALVTIVPNFYTASQQILMSGQDSAKTITLSDGSEVVLDSGSRVNATMRRHERNMELVSGESWFHVAKDKSRPFTVKADTVTVTAVGTAFSVSRRDGIAVVVSEGIVTLAVGTTAPLRVHRNQAASIVQGRVQITNIGDEDVRRKLAWRDGSIGFDGETLVEAAASFNRFNKIQIVVSDNELGQRRVAGWFSRSDPAGFAQASATMLGAKATVKDDRIVLSR